MNIKEIRESARMSQREFSNKLNIPIKTLQHWEQGDSQPAPYLLSLIAKEFPQTMENMEIIKRKKYTFYIDQCENAVYDEKGTKILLTNDISRINRHNLGVYLEFLFDEHYKSKNDFEERCKIDETDNIEWEIFY